MRTTRRTSGLSASLIGMVVALGAQAAAPQPHVTVPGNDVRLGDIFADAGPHADRILFRAPAPGKRVVLDARWLHRAAQAYGLDWAPKAGSERVIVERSSNRISQDTIRAALRRSLLPRLGGNGRFEIAIDNKALRIFVPGEDPATVGVHSLRHDPGSGRFSAVLAAPEGRADAARIAVSGKVYRLIEVPVPVRRMRRGGIIRAGDLRLQSMRAGDIDRAALTDARDIIGKTPRRVLAMDKPVRVNDVREPILVQKRGLVTMVFRTHNMVITSQGKARDAGALGETVRITNTSSGKTVEAVVIGPDQVEVRASSLIAAR